MQHMQKALEKHSKVEDTNEKTKRKEFTQYAHWNE